MPNNEADDDGEADPDAGKTHDQIRDELLAELAQM